MALRSGALRSHIYTVPVLGTSFVNVDIRGVKFPGIPCLVLDLALDWTIILGQQFLQSAKVSLDYEHSIIRGYTRKSKPFTFRCSSDYEPFKRVFVRCSRDAGYLGHSGHPPNAQRL